MSDFQTTQLVAPVKEIYDRLNAAAQTGKLLSGLKIFPFPLPYNQGEDDLPNLSVMLFEDDDRVSAGAKKGALEKGNPAPAGNETPSANTNVETSAKLTLFLAVSREAGLFMDEGGTKPGMLDWLYRVKDVIETSIDGSTVDATLARTCLKAVQVSARDAVVGQVAWRLAVEVAYTPQPFHRGTRQDIWVVEAPAIAPISANLPSS